MGREVPRDPGRSARAHWLAVGVAALAGLLGLPHPSGREIPVAPPPPLPPALAALAAVHIHGDPALTLLTRRSLERVLSTRVGARACALLERPGAPPLTIELNLRGDDFTPYRVPGESLDETIVFDPWTLPTVETVEGREPATRETVLAHELGHALFKLRSEADVIREVENPVREELGLPRRARF